MIEANYDCIQKYEIEINEKKIGIRAWSLAFNEITTDRRRTNRKPTTRRT